MPLSDRQLFEFELEQLKTIELLENEEMWAQRVIDEAASRSISSAELNAARDSSESSQKPSWWFASGYARYQRSECLGSESSRKIYFGQSNHLLQSNLPDALENGSNQLFTGRIVT